MYFYDCEHDMILGIEPEEQLESFNLPEGVSAYFYITAANELIWLRKQDAQEFIRPTLEEAKRARQEYLNKQIDKYERLKVDDPQVIEFD